MLLLTLQEAESYELLIEFGIGIFFLGNTWKF